MADQFVKEMLDAGVHFGHLTRKWNPNMAPYIFMERNGIHIIDLYKTQAKIDIAAEALAKIAASGRKIMYVATKKQAKEILERQAGGVNMPYITERWPGGMLTNFVTIRKAIKKMQNIDRMKEDGSYLTLSKRERLQVDRQRDKLDRQLGSIADMTRLPGALFIIDINKEHIAVKEAQKLGIPTFAIVDTNSDPNQVDYAIPGNDDATKSIDLLVTKITDAIRGGLEERNVDKNKAKDAKLKKAAARAGGDAVEEEVVAETKVVAKAAVVAEPKAVAETKVVTEEKVAAEPKVVAEAKAVAEPKVVTEEKVVTETKKD